ncbi:hypothetical protein, partial [Mesorhizobium sp. M7A.F.Ca.CA.004.11.2.1]|uniref:hypothetical protein n=1 Tax=Mesorhizobium sp. M7A.F.Ca.CA.004.11.2.1 TaxID=2496699 RepID=UPI0019CF6DA4
AGEHIHGQPRGLEYRVNVSGRAAKFVRAEADPEKSGRTGFIKRNGFDDELVLPSRNALRFSRRHSPSG